MTQKPLPILVYAGGFAGGFLFANPIGLGFLFGLVAVAGWLRAPLLPVVAVVALLAAFLVLTGLLCRRLTHDPAANTFTGPAVAGCFGIAIIVAWQIACTGFHVPPVLLPAPSAILARLFASLPMLGADFVQTVVKAVIPGWIMGCLLGFAVALACDRSDFLRRGLMPIGNFVSALPIIGIAPILVMWFGFDWQSKAAVVVVMTFFPMLVNTVAGLASAGHLERDLMKSYGASWGTTLLSLRLPAAMPFIFNALKINATLAMIGAIVAEFFGTPVVGMGFRISTEVGRMAIDMVWATIVVAAVAGSAFYGLIALIERRVTFWHPSMRAR
jgi:NitT/TauT family transport system permease protein